MPIRRFGGDRPHHGPGLIPTTGAEEIRATAAFLATASRAERALRPLEGLQRLVGTSGAQSAQIPVEADVQTSRPPATTAFSVRSHLRTTLIRTGSCSPTTASLISMATVRWAPQILPSCWVVGDRARLARWILTTMAKSVRPVSRLYSVPGVRVNRRTED